MPSDTPAPRRLVLALCECLRQLVVLVEATTDADYTWRPPSGVSGSVGAHVRHCLDHVHAILERAGDPRLTYDHRRRDPRPEEDRPFAVDRLHEAIGRLGESDRLEQHLTLDVQVDRAGTVVSVASSLGRELAFVLQHTIHHQALIAVLLAERGAFVPHGFGYAPSTPTPAREGLACAR